jgi:hypothetical protein
MFSVRRVGNVGAPATVEREKIRKQEDYDYIWMYWHLEMSRSGRASLRRERSENSRRKRRRHELRTLERKNGRCTVRLFGTNSFKEGAM